MSLTLLPCCLAMTLKVPVKLGCSYDDETFTIEITSPTLSLL